MKQVIQIRSARKTPKGREVPARYLRSFVYPPLLSGKKVEVVSTTDPDYAHQYSGVSTEGAIALLFSLGYDEAALVDLT